MTVEDGISVHASAVLVGERAILIRGPSGAGKSRLAFALILAGRAGQIPPTLLIADDRVLLESTEDGLLASPVAALEGMIEIRGLGIRKCQFASKRIVDWVIDLDADEGARMPDETALRTVISGVEVKRIPVPPGYEALPLIVAALTTT